MKTEIIFVRHGETEANRLNVFRGQLDVKLNENGYKQAEDVAKALSHRNISAVYSSPLQRALETAKIICKYHNQEVKISNGLNNINLGEWQGKSRDDLKKFHPEFWNKWVHDTENVEIPGGETLGQVKDRTVKTVKELIEENRGKTILIVSHRCALKVCLAGLLEIEGRYFWKFFLDNCSYSIVEYDDCKGFTLTLLNESCHISKKVYEEF